jgi:four helix bundle protein
MKKNVLKDKSLNFAIRIVKRSQYLNSEKKEFVMSKQLLRSGTTIGALVRESERAESKQDFIHTLPPSDKKQRE